MIHITEDEYRSILMGEYRLIPCTCECGVIYVDGYIGEEVSLQNYRRLQEDTSRHIHMYSITCPECHGVGKKIRFD